MPRPTCFRLFTQVIRCALLFALLSAGSSIPARIAIIAMTTSSSIKVKARETPVDVPRALRFDHVILTEREKLIRGRTGTVQLVKSYSQQRLPMLGSMIRHRRMDLQR